MVRGHLRRSAGQRRGDGAAVRKKPARLEDLTETKWRRLSAADRFKLATPWWNRYAQDWQNLVERAADYPDLQIPLLRALDSTGTLIHLLQCALEERGAKGNSNAQHDPAIRERALELAAAISPSVRSKKARASLVHTRLLPEFGAETTPASETIRGWLKTSRRLTH